jgi:hypothetical protein
MKVEPEDSSKHLISIEDDNQLRDLNYMLPLEAYDSHELPIFGCYLAKRKGTYVFLFDNRYGKHNVKLTEFKMKVTPLMPCKGKWKE